MNEPVWGSVWTHKTKGGKYLVYNVIINKTDDSRMVLYFRMDVEHPKRQFFVRTLDNWYDRFELTELPAYMKPE